MHVYAGRPEANNTHLPRLEVKVRCLPQLLSALFFYFYFWKEGLTSNLGLTCSARLRTAGQKIPGMFLLCLQNAGILGDGDGAVPSFFMWKLGP